MSLVFDPRPSSITRPKLLVRKAVLFLTSSLCGLARTVLCTGVPKSFVEQGESAELNAGEPNASVCGGDAWVFGVRESESVSVHISTVTRERG